MKKIIIYHDPDLDRQIVLDATKERRPVGGHELVGMVVVDVNRNALGEIVLFMEMPGEKRGVGVDGGTGDFSVVHCCHGQPLGDPCEGCVEESEALRTAGLAATSDKFARQKAKDQQATAAYMLKQGKAQADRSYP